MLIEYFLYDKLWGPSQRVVTLFLNNIISITMKGLATVRVLVATVTGRAQTTLLALSVIPLMALSAMLSIRERR